MDESSPSEPPSELSRRARREDELLRWTILGIALFMAAVVLGYGDVWPSPDITRLGRVAVMLLPVAFVAAAVTLLGSPARHEEASQ